MIFLTRSPRARKNQLFSSFAAFLLLARLATAQPTYPPGQFLFPILPGQTNYLSGNMGELRPNHFHGGLDIRTQGREGLSVFASADGYVSRVKVSRTGYGNVVYVTHRNGFVTVYAHLKTFNSKIGDYVRSQQYAQKTFEIELLPDSTALPVKRGEVVGLSGNTGSSGGPHLHYEIRDSQENALNPQHFGFKEVQDHTPPLLDRIALQAVRLDSRVRGEFARLEFVPRKLAAATYAIKDPIPVWGTVGLELLASDQTDGSGNRNGISGMEVKLDGRTVFTHRLDKFAFDASRSINVHVNYAHFLRTGNRFQRCYVADGNQLGTYKTASDNGLLSIRDTNLHTVLVTVWDANQNTSRLQFSLRGVPPAAPAPVVRVASSVAQWRPSLHENTLAMQIAQGESGLQPAQLYFRGKPRPVEVTYTKENQAFYLWDLRKGLPDSVVSGSGKVSTPFNYRKMIPARQRMLYEEDSLSILFEETTLFDTLYLETARKGDRFLIGRLDIPLRESIDVRLKPAIPPAERAKTAVFAVTKAGRLVYQGGTWVGDQISFKAKELGTFTVARDTVPPVAKLVSATPARITCRISDNLAGIGQVNAYLNGQWLLMQYDYKTSLIWSDPLDGQKPMKGRFVLEVTDSVGNLTKLEANL